MPDDVVSTIAQWQAEWQARELQLHVQRRLVPPGNLHVTLAFLGSHPAAELPSILAALEQAARVARQEPFAPSGAAAFLSRLPPSGAPYRPPEYVLLESFRLGG